MIELFAGTEHQIWFIAELTAEDCEGRQQMKWIFRALSSVDMIERIS